MIRLMVALLAAYLLVGCGSGSKPAASAPYTRPAPHDPAIAALIDQLGSKFPPYVFSHPGDPDPEWPSDREMEARKPDEERVWEVRGRLKSLGLAAFSDLVANCDDPRFSYIMAVQAYHNYSVGEACFFIIQEQVSPDEDFYLSRHRPGGGTFVQPFYMNTIRQNPGLRAWWEGHKNLTLRDLQVEALEWTIQQEKVTGFTDDVERRRVLDPLERRLANLRAQN
jgi:hypothetical protein